MDYPLTYQRISSYDDMDQHLHTIADDILRANRVATYSNHPERERGDLAGPNFGTLIAKDRIVRSCPAHFPFLPLRLSN